MEGEHARQGGVLACFALGFARLKEIGKNTTTFLQAEYLRPTCVAGADRGGERRGEGARVNSFQLVFFLVCACHEANLTQNFNSSIYMAILRTTLSDIRTWQKIVFVLGHPR